MTDKPDTPAAPSTEEVAEYDREAFLRDARAMAESDCPVRAAYGELCELIVPQLDAWFEARQGRALEGDEAWDAYLADSNAIACALGVAMGVAVAGAESADVRRFMVGELSRAFRLTLTQAVELDEDLPADPLALARSSLLRDAGGEDPARAVMARAMLALGDAVGGWCADEKGRGTDPKLLRMAQVNAFAFFTGCTHGEGLDPELRMAVAASAGTLFVNCLLAHLGASAAQWGAEGPMAEPQGHA